MGNKDYIIKGCTDDVAKSELIAELVREAVTARIANGAVSVDDLRKYADIIEQTESSVSYYKKRLDDELKKRSEVK